jgi:hypothetical protein
MQKLNWLPIKDDETDAHYFRVGSLLVLLTDSLDSIGKKELEFFVLAADHPPPVRVNRRWKFMDFYPFDPGTDQFAAAEPLVEKYVRSMTDNFKAEVATLEKFLEPVPPATVRFDSLVIGDLFTYPRYPGRVQVRTSEARGGNAIIVFSLDPDDVGWHSDFDRDDQVVPVKGKLAIQEGV